MLRIWLHRWAERVPADEESAQFLVDSVRSFLMYATAVAAAALLLNMIGLLEPIERVLSFPVVKVGKTGITIWVVIKALLILFFFIYASRLLQAYLDYKVYPAFGVEQGPGYAVNTIIRLAFFGVGLLIALDTVGVDFGFLLVFAGAIGVGIGLGLQSMAANLISGFIIIFGGKVQKGRLDQGRRRRRHDHRHPCPVDPGAHARQRRIPVAQLQPGVQHHRQLHAVLADDLDIPARGGRPTARTRNRWNGS